ncbi:MAG: alpha/beta hydrolase fold domain-containing protein [Bacteroidales bacterium]|nr:alpha/beta hydrolase fold domain-containing protein [Bacteroidales bacterium]
MKKFWFASLLLLVGALAAAQPGFMFGQAAEPEGLARPARQFTLDLTPDGAARMVVYLPQEPTGRAVVCCPGGGYAVLSNTHEGSAWAPFFNERGIAFALVNYRIPHGDRSLPFSDVENAMKTMRDSAAVWQLNPHDIGIMGSSAGGHLASTIATHTPFELRPDFQILIYPVITMGRGTHQGSVDGLLGDLQNDPDLIDLYSNEKQVRGHLTPPAILLLASDDDLVPPVPNAVAYYTAMRAAGNSCSLHIYPTGGHGFGFMPFFAYHDQMVSDLSAWLENLKAPKRDAVRVACIGDSITDGYMIDLCDVNGYPAQMQQMLGEGYWVRNFGVSARTLLSKGDLPYVKDLAWEDAQAFRPDVVVIKLGTNDSKDYNWVHKADFASDLQQMIDALQALPSRPKIYLATPIPAFKRSWTINEQVIRDEIIPILENAVKKNGLAGLIDLHTPFLGSEDLIVADGIHPNREGARKIAGIVAKAIDPAARTEPQGFFMMR